MTKHSPFKYFKTSSEIIRLAVMYYIRYPLSFRQVEDILHERGVDICHETVRFWWNRFGPMFASEIASQFRHYFSEGVHDMTVLDPEKDGAIMSLSKDMSYSDYLSLDPILGAQKLQSTAHDEMLFIIQHQTSELWMRLCLHELSTARTHLIVQEIEPAMKMLARVAQIFEQLNNAWDVLRTMTPSEYTQFRDDLGTSSGFQSHQYRLIEFMLGNRNLAMMKIHEHRPELHRMLDQELQTKSLYHVVLDLLAEATGTIFPSVVYTSNTPHLANEAVMSAWVKVYKNPKQYWALYALAEKLVDLEDYFRRWRFNHVTTVERIIGFKRGTGGTSGVKYLRKMLEVELFPELWHLRGIL